jgi:hypothetical protein
VVIADVEPEQRVGELECPETTWVLLPENRSSSPRFYIRNKSVNDKTG